MFQLQATIDRIEEGNAVLIFEDGQQLIIDQADLDQEVVEGQIVFFDIKFNPQKTLSKEIKAKELLQEILNNQDNEN